MAIMYEHYNLGDDGSSGAATTTWYSQTFTIGTVSNNVNQFIDKVKLKLYRIGLPGNVDVSIRATDQNGSPSGADLSTGSTNGNALTVDANGAWYEIDMTSYELQKETTYAIVIRATAAPGGAFVHWRRDTTAPTYTGGSVYSSIDSGVTWVLSAADDFMFEVWCTLGTVKTTIRELYDLFNQANYGKADFATNYAVNVGAASTAIAFNRPTRKGVILYNNSSKTVYLSAGTAAVATGFPFVAGAYMDIQNWTKEVNGIVAAGAADVRVWTIHSEA